MNGLRIAQSSVGDHLVLALEGELSVLSSYAFNQGVDKHVRESRVLKVVLDVGDLSLIDSSGLGAIAKLHGELQLLGGCLHLARIRANLLEMLYIAKLDRALTWHKTVQDAVDACAGMAPAPAVPDPLSAAVVARPDPLGGPVPPSAAGAEKETDFGELPEHEGCANYPTWFVIHWLSTHQEIQPKVAAAIGQSADPEAAAAEVQKLVGQYATAAVDQASVAAGLSSFALRFVDWRDVVRKMRGKLGL